MVSVGWGRGYNFKWAVNKTFRQSCGAGSDTSLEFGRKSGMGSAFGSVCLHNAFEKTMRFGETTEAVSISREECRG